MSFHILHGEIRLYIFDQLLTLVKDQEYGRVKTKLCFLGISSDAIEFKHCILAWVCTLCAVSPVYVLTSRYVPRFSIKFSVDILGNTAEEKCFDI